MAASFRIYSFVEGHSSWVRVGHGLAQGLARCGRDVTLFPIDDLGHELDVPVGEGQDADIGIIAGPPSLASLMSAHGEHRLKMAMIAPNSTWLPKDMFSNHELYGLVDHYLSPSPWGRSILQRYTERPVSTWKHGVDPGIFHPDWPHGPLRLAPYPAPGDAGPSVVFRRDDEPACAFEVLHLASTHFQRKGTQPLIWAWAQAMQVGSIPLDSKLRLVCDGPPGYFQGVIEEAIDMVSDSGREPRRHLGQLLRESIELHGRLDLSPERAAIAYREHDFVCQPSRAEGFGLVPLEARACGVPAIMTEVTGHACHAVIAPASVIPVSIPSHNGKMLYEPIDDGPDAEAPMVLCEDVALALGEASAAAQHAPDWRAACSEAATQLCEEFSWEAVTREFLEQHDF